MHRKQYLALLRKTNKVNKKKKNCNKKGGNKLKKKRCKKGRKGAGKEKILKFITGDSKSKYKIFPLLNYLIKTRGKQRRNLVNNITSKEMGELSKIINKLIHSKIPISNIDLNKLSKNKKYLNALTNKTTSLEKNKRILSQHGGFLGSIVAPLLTGAVGGLIKLLK